MQTPKLNRRSIEQNSTGRFVHDEEGLSNEMVTCPNLLGNKKGDRPSGMSEWNE